MKKILVKDVKNEAQTWIKYLFINTHIHIQVSNTYKKSIQNQPKAYKDTSQLQF